MTKITFAKIFPYGVDVYTIWDTTRNDTPMPTKKKIFEEAESLFNDWDTDVSRSIERYYEEGGIWQFVLNKVPVVYACINSEVWGKTIDGPWKKYERDQLPFGWNMT